MTAVVEGGFVVDLDEATYHADLGSLSVSGAKLLLRSPEVYRWALDHPVQKDAYDVGSAFHSKVLGSGAEIVVVEAASWRGKAAEEQQAAARAAGKVPILVADDLRTTAMAHAVLDSPQAMRWLDGAPEVSAYAVDPETGVLRRGRFDCIGEYVLADLKSTRDASVDAFAADAARFHYHMQAAWYLDLAADLGHPARAFVFIAVEKDPPHHVNVIELDRPALELGRRLNRVALDLYAGCVDSDYWPGYIHPDQEFHTVSLPGWAYKEDPA